jgi:hypothetical protein
MLLRLSRCYQSLCLSYFLTPALHITNEDLIHFNLYPNPTSDQLIIESDRKGTIFIYDVKGSLVVKLQVESGITMLNVVSFPIGIYRVVLLNVKKEIVQQKSFVVD